jgi:hypothetical protein
MTATTSVAFLLLCAVCYVVVRDLLRAPRMYGLRKRLMRERNRNRFGELRTELVRQAAAGELNPRSQIFESIYRGTTSLMRNPYALEAAAQAILQIPAPEQQRGRGTRPTRAEGEVAQDFARRIDMLCRDYSKVYVASAWILDRLTGPWSRPPLWIEMIAARAKLQRMRPMVEARKRLEGTAQLAAA